MNTSHFLNRFSRRLTSRRGAWVTIAVSLLIMTALFGVFGSAKAPARNDSAPADSESRQAAELLAQFPNADRQTVIVVGSRADGAALTAAQLTELENLLPVLSQHGAADPTGPMLSEDGKAALLLTPIQVGASNSETAELIKVLRTDLASAGAASSGIELQVTGGPAFGADVAASFEGADFTLLLVTILIVAVLLIITHRSPVLMLIPLLTVALADGLAGRVTAVVGAAWDLQFDADMFSVLVFGAETNYGQLLIFHYQEELFTTLVPVNTACMPNRNGYGGQQIAGLAIPIDIGSSTTC